MLIQFDPCDVDQERDRGHVFEQQAGALIVRVVLPPVWAQWCVLTLQIKPMAKCFKGALCRSLQGDLAIILFSTTMMWR